LEWTLALAIRAEGDLDFCLGILIEWSQGKATLETVEFDVFELGENAATTGDDSSYTDQIVEICTTKVTKSAGSRKVGDAHMDFRVDTLIGGEEHENSPESHLVEDGKHGSGTIG